MLEKTNGYMIPFAAHEKLHSLFRGEHSLRLIVRRWYTYTLHLRPKIEFVQKKSITYLYLSFSGHSAGLSTSVKELLNDDEKTL